MKPQYPMSRRTAVKSAFFGMVAASIPNIVFGSDIYQTSTELKNPENLFHRYPSIDDLIVAEMVGASHFNFKRVQELVNQRQELARATWDWAFGDWETALGAASHVGRRDIATFLIDNGARPDIFTYAMLADHKAVMAMIESTPGVQSIAGPHGISLLQHAKAGLRSKELTTEQKSNSNKLINYLESLGNADLKATNLEMSETDKQKYVGDYMYGEGEKDGFSIKLNRRKMLSLGKLGKFGGGLWQKSPNIFTYNGITSVEIEFTLENDTVIALTVKEPDLMLKAKKIS